MEIIPASRALYPGDAKPGELLYVQGAKGPILAFLAHDDSASDEDRRRLIIALMPIAGRPAPSWSAVIGNWPDAVSIGDYLIELGIDQGDIRVKGDGRTIPNGAIIVGEDAHLLKVAAAHYPEVNGSLLYNLRTGSIASKTGAKYGIISRWSVRLKGSDRSTPPLFSYLAKASKS